MRAAKINIFSTRQVFFEKFDQKLALTLAVDAGNSRVKVGLFTDNQAHPESVHVFKNAKTKLREFLLQHQKEALIFSSVSGLAMEEVVPAELSKKVKLDHLTPLPFVSQYASQETLGTDRMANAAALSTLYKGKKAICIDSGTCLKFDYVDEKGHYHGGSIAPGLNMRMKAMHEFTGRLPLFEVEKNTPLTGQSTRESMLAGGVTGFKAEVREMVNLYRQQYPELTIVITGGDMWFLQDALKNNIFAEKDFTLIGLNSILMHLIHEHQFFA